MRTHPLFLDDPRPLENSAPETPWEGTYFHLGPLPLKVSINVQALPKIVVKVDDKKQS
jgi:hypothetical protein